MVLALMQAIVSEADILLQKVIFQNNLSGFDLVKLFIKSPFFLLW